MISVRFPLPLSEWLVVSGSGLSVFCDWARHPADFGFRNFTDAAAEELYEDG